MTRLVALALLLALAACGGPHEPQVPTVAEDAPEWLLNADRWGDPSNGIRAPQTDGTEPSLPLPVRLGVYRRAAP